MKNYRYDEKFNFCDIKKFYTALVGSKTHVEFSLLTLKLGGVLHFSNLKLVGSGLLQFINYTQRALIILNFEKKGLMVLSFLFFFLVNCLVLIYDSKFR